MTSHSIVVAFSLRRRDGRTYGQISCDSVGRLPRLCTASHGKTGLTYCTVYSRRRMKIDQRRYIVVNHDNNSSLSVTHLLKRHLRVSVVDVDEKLIYQRDE